MTANSNALTNPNLVNKLNSKKKKKLLGKGKNTLFWMCYLWGRAEAL